MARKRMKDKSDFSILIKFPERLRASALLVLGKVKEEVPVITITEQLPEGDQKYTYILVEMSSHQG